MVILDQDTVLSAYRAFVAQNSRLPRSIKELSITQGLHESSIRAQFPTIHEVTQRIWEDIVSTAVVPVITAGEYPLFTKQERIVALLLAIIDRCASEGLLVEVTFTFPLNRPISCGLPLSDSVVGLRRGLIRVLRNSQGEENSMFEREAFSLALLAALAFWLTDRTPERLQTEAFVDQIATVVASAGKPGFGTTLAEIASFLSRTRLSPILSSILRYSACTQPKYPSDAIDE